VIRGASNAEIEDIFRVLAERWQTEFRLAGVVAETHGLSDRFCQAGYLRHLPTGTLFSIFHDGEPGMAECHLGGNGAVAAAAAVQRDIAAGCDLVLLNKFGQLEAVGDGLAGAFRTAIATHLPLLTSVSPTHDQAWQQFADRQYAILPADVDAIDRWRRTVQACRVAVTLPEPTTSEYMRGMLYAVAAVTMWTTWIVAVRLGIRTSITPWDITAIRFGVAGLILLPYLLKKGLAVHRLGWLGLAAILMGGAPTVLVSYGGLVFAPAAHAASLFTALIPLYVAILAAVVLGEAFNAAKQIGLALVVIGVLGIVWGMGATIGSRQNFGNAMFISAGLLFAGYTVAMRKARLDGLHAAAIAAVVSLVTYVPVYAIVFGSHLFSAPWPDLVLQAFVHGILCVSLILWGRAISLLGASNGSAFAALAPAITAMLGIPVLGELPTTTDWVAMVLISGGVYIASAGPLPLRRGVSAEFFKD
jgi:drug/metabolite transporter (DMT)-like permease